MTISNENDRLTIIIPKYLKDQIKDLADRENRSMGNYVAHILEEYVKQQHDMKDGIVMEKQLVYNSYISDEDMEETVESVFNLIDMKIKEKYNKNTSDK